MFKGSRGTLLFFVWVFYIISGFLNLWDAFIYFSSGNPFTWSYLVMVPLDLFLILGGLYFVFHIQKLLPRYYSEVIRVVTAIFIIDVLHGLVYLPSTLSNPAELSSTFSGNPLAWVLGLTTVGIAFNYLIYLVVINSIKHVSGIEKKQTAQQTLFYWAIVLVFFTIMLGLILWNPTTNSFNVL